MKLLTILGLLALTLSQSYARTGWMRMVRTFAPSDSKIEIENFYNIKRIGQGRQWTIRPGVGFQFRVFGVSNVTPSQNLLSGSFRNGDMHALQLTSAKVEGTNLVANFSDPTGKAGSVLFYIPLSQVLGSAYKTNAVYSASLEGITEQIRETSTH